MVWHRLTYYWPAFRRRTCACLALAGYLAAAIGFPLPNLSHKDHSQPFPCQDHPCGCQSAEECWRHCCCFTPAEHFTWAAEHHIKPPAYAARPDACQTDCVATGASCCNKHTDSNSCCSAHSTRPAQASPTKPSARKTWVLGIASLGCHGLATSWISIGAVLPSPLSPGWGETLPLTGWVSQRNTSARPLIYPPPDPPPRSFCV